MPMMAGISEAGAEIGGLANADEVKRPVEDMRQKIKPASRLARLIRDAPEVRKDFEALQKAKLAGKAMPKGRNFH
jgi:error-prone DNA polymerase